MNRYVTVTLKVSAARDLLAQLPKCTRCGMRAELTLDGMLRCVPCAGTARAGRAENPQWTNAADVLEVALSPFEVAG